MHITNKCKYADKIDKYNGEIYGSIVADWEPKKYLKILAKEDSLLEIMPKTTTISIEKLRSGKRILQSVLKEEWIKEIQKTIIQRYDLKDAIITDCAISLSGACGYGADNLHRDGIIGKRIKVSQYILLDQNAQIYCIPHSNIPTLPTKFDR